MPVMHGEHEQRADGRDVLADRMREDVTMSVHRFRGCT